MKQLNTIQVSGHKVIPSPASFFKLILFMCTYFIYMCICVVAQGGQKRESEPPGAGVAGRCEPHGSSG